MKLPKFTRRRILGILLAIPLLPMALWVVVLCLAPTDWARERLVSELEAMTGQKVAIGSIQLGPLGNLRIKNVSVAERANAADPWLRVSEARLDLHLFQMVMGCCKTSDVSVDRLDLRVHRRGDGRLEFADMFDRPTGGSSQGGDSENVPARKCVTFTFSEARIVVIDDLSGSTVELTEAVGSANWDGTQAIVSALHGRLNGGTAEFAGRYVNAPVTPAFDAELRARGVSTNKGMKALGLLVPVVSATSALDGRLDLELAIQGRCDSLVAFKSSLKGHGSIRLDPIDLSRSKLLDSLDALRQIPAARRIGSVESDFAIANGRVVIDDLTVNLAGLPIVFAGWNDFDGRLDYTIKSAAMHDRIATRLPREARALLSDVRRELGDLTEIRVTGTVDDPRVSLAGRPVDGRGPGRKETEAKLRDVAKKLGEKYLR